MARQDSTIADKIVDAARSGKEAKFIVGGIEYEFTPAGIKAVIEASTILTFSNLPTSDPNVAGQVWNDDGVLTVSSG